MLDDMSGSLHISLVVFVPPGVTDLFAVTGLRQQFVPSRMSDANPGAR